MKWFDRWNKKEIDEELQAFEMKLESVLPPVVPRSEFVVGLRQNLLKQNIETGLLPEAQNQRLQTGILVTGGVLGIIVMVLTGVRGVVSIVGVIGLLVNFIRQDTQEVTTPPNFAH